MNRAARTAVIGWDPTQETRGLAREFAYAITAVAIEFQIPPGMMIEREPDDIAKEARWMLGWILHRVHGWSTGRIRDHLDLRGAALGANIRRIDLAVRCHGCVRPTIVNILQRMERASRWRWGEIDGRARSCHSAS